MRLHCQCAKCSCVSANEGRNVSNLPCDSVNDFGLWSRLRQREIAYHGFCHFFTQTTEIRDNLDAFLPLFFTILRFLKNCIVTECFKSVSSLDLYLLNALFYKKLMPDYTKHVYVNSNCVRVRFCVYVEIFVRYYVQA